MMRWFCGIPLSESSAIRRRRSGESGIENVAMSLWTLEFHSRTPSAKRNHRPLLTRSRMGGCTQGSWKGMRSIKSWRSGLSHFRPYTLYNPPPVNALGYDEGWLREERPPPPPSLVWPWSLSGARTWYAGEGVHCGRACVLARRIFAETECNNN